jgi:hypothetical protein
MSLDEDKTVYTLEGRHGGKIKVALFKERKTATLRLGKFYAIQGEIRHLNGKPWGCNGYDRDPSGIWFVGVTKETRGDQGQTVYRCNLYLNKGEMIAEDIGEWFYSPEGIGYTWGDIPLSEYHVHYPFIQVDKYGNIIYDNLYTLDE